MELKVLTWNVNSLKTLRSWHPFSDKTLYPDFNTILNSLDADVLCLQEVKSTKANLETEFYTLKDYHAFFSLHPTEGYSGVATFVKKSFPIPSKCELGFSGLLDPSSGISASSSSSIEPNEGSKHLVEEFGKSELLQLDGEGRCLILQWGRLILFNVYFPASSEKESRQAFKAKFSEAVQFRADLLVGQGYKVIVAGDFNAIRRAIDRYDIRKDEELVDHPPSKWINSWCDSTMIDSFRHLRPNQPRVFTCWDLKENKRPLNDGSRIDYHLVSKNMARYISECSVLHLVYGSDHAPVVLTLKDDDRRSEAAIDAHSTNTIAAGTCMMFGDLFVPPPKPPIGCSSYWASFGDKQPKISFSQTREKGSHDANLPSLSSRLFGQKAKATKKSLPPSKLKSNTSSGSVPGPKQGKLTMFVKSSQFKS